MYLDISKYVENLDYQIQKTIDLKAIKCISTEKLEKLRDVVVGELERRIIMSEIDVSECKHYKNKTCIVDYLLTDMPFEEAKCELNPNCYFRQLQQLKAENEELKKGIVLECPQCGETYLNKIGCELYEEKQKYKQCLDEIEEKVKDLKKRMFL